MTIKPSSQPQAAPPSSGGYLTRLLFSAAAAAFGAGTMSAQTPVATTTDETIKLEQFVVQGFRQSLAASLDAKRAAGANIDVITAEDVGKFPDTNLAESLSHIPGVTIDRLFGDGERVSILGTDPNLNRTLLNGQPIATADWYILDTPSRQFNYVLLAPEVIGKAEVYRTWQPRLLEGSIGGTIIVHTLSPLNTKRPVGGALSVTETYNQLSEKWEPSFSATVSWRNPEKTLGILVGALDQKEFLRRDGVEALGVLGNYTDSNGIVGQNTFTDPSYPQVGMPTKQGTGPNRGFATVEVINTALFEQLRHRRGANAAVEYKPFDKVRIDLTGLYVDQKMDNTNTSLYPMYMVGTAAVNPTFQNNVMTSATYFGNQLEFDLFARKAEIKTQVYNGKVTFDGDDFKVIGQLGYTRATGGTTMQAYRGANVFVPYSISQGTHSASFSAVTGPTYTTTGDVVLDPVSKNSGWGGLVEAPQVDQEKWVQADFEFPVRSVGSIKKLVTGFRSSEHNTSETSAHQVAFFGPNERNYHLLFRAAPSNYLDGFSGVTAAMKTHPVGDFNAIFNQTANTPASKTDVDAGYWPGLVIGQTLADYSKTHPYAVINNWLAIPTDSATVGPTFEAKETINAAYVEAEFSSGRLTGNFGVRFVDTNVSGTSIAIGRISGSPFANALPGGEPLTAASLGQYGAPGYQPLSERPNWTKEQWDATEVPINKSVNRSSTNVLPAMNLAFEVSRDQVLRFAVAQVMSRPNLLQEFDYTTLYPINTPGDVGGNGVGGTPNLDPYKSVNLDLDYEHYFTKNSYFAIDLFYKNITNYIVNRTTPEIHANTTTWQDQWFYVTRPQNGGSATSKGFAIAYQHEFANGFGIQANYTRLWAEGASGPLPFASKNQVNIGPYFENKWGLLRVTASWRDDFATGSFNGASTVYTRPYTSLDANANINLGHGVSLVLTARNILNEPYQQYFTNPVAGGREIFADAYRVGTTFSAGVHFRF